MGFQAAKDRLTESQIGDELTKLMDVENKTGFLYFLENYVYVEHPRGYAFLGDGGIFQWQTEAAPKFLSSRYVIAKKRRQVGYSTLVGAYALWRALLFDSQIINVVSIKLKDSTTFLRRTKFIYNKLPVWMKQRKIEDAKTIMAFEHNGSTISSLPLTDDPARGDTLSLLVLDEFAAMRNAPNVLAAGVPSLAAGSEIPFSNSSLPSQLFIISTYPENPINNEYVRLLNMAREDPDTGYAVVDVDPSDIPYYKNDQWKKEQLDLLGHKRYAVEIEGEEPIDSENCLLPTYVLQDLHDVPPIRCDFLMPDDIDEEGYYKDLNVLGAAEDNFDETIHYIKGLWIWENPNPENEYVVACDVAKGVGGSASTFIVLNLNTMEQAAEYENDRIDIEGFKKIIEIVVTFYNKAKLSIENNGLGIGVVAYFSETKMYDNLYYHRMSKKRYEPGFPMGVNTRGPAIVQMQSILTNKEITIKSIRLINQLRNFGYTNHGKIKALGNGRDDIVLALCQLCYLLNSGWAVSLKQIQNERPLGIISSQEIDDMNKKDEEERLLKSNQPKSKILKYWEDDFGVDFDSLDDRTKEAIEIIKSSGMSVTREDIENILKGNY